MSARTANLCQASYLYPKSMEPGVPSSLCINGHHCWDKAPGPAPRIFLRENEHTAHAFLLSDPCINRWNVRAVQARSGCS